MFKFSAVSQIWKKYIQKLNDWDLPLTRFFFKKWLGVDYTVMLILDNFNIACLC